MRHTGNLICIPGCCLQAGQLRDGVVTFAYSYCARTKRLHVLLLIFGTIYRHCLHYHFARVGPFRPDSDMIRANGSYKWPNTRTCHFFFLPFILLNGSTCIRPLHPFSGCFVLQCTSLLVKWYLCSSVYEKGAGKRTEST